MARVCVLTVQTRLQELLQFQNNVLQQGEVKQSRPPLRNASPRAADCIEHAVRLSLTLELHYRAFEAS